MTEAEGTHTPMRILYERWKEPPHVVIYDNSCNLHRSCVIHEGHAFKNTEFFHDRLHQWNHTSCCDGYDMSKQDMTMLHAAFVIDFVIEDHRCARFIGNCNKDFIRIAFGFAVRL